MKNKFTQICFFIFILITFFIICSIFYFQSPTVVNQISIMDNTKKIISQKEKSVLESNNTLENFEKVSTQNKSIIEQDITIKMTVIGDIMCHNSQYNDAFNNGFYDFSYVFQDVKPYIENSDISIGNLETTFAGKEKGYSSYPNFNTPEALAYNLKDLGIDVLSTANNHSLDSGYQGIESTIDYLNDAEISHTGTFKSQDEQNTILFKDVNGIKIAFLAYTYGTNGISIPKDKEYCVNLIDKELISFHLELAKKENPDVICVNMHWGTEYQTTPNKTQIDLLTFLFENGADIILGSHPHVLQPMEKYTITMPDGTSKDGFGIYSLGNFMSGQTKENTRSSIILNLEITKKRENGKVTIDNFSYIPIYTFTSPNFKNYKILDIQKTLQNYESGIDTSIGKSNYTLLKSELEKIHSHIKFNY